MQIHISNLHSNLLESDLQRLFAPFGEVEDVQLVRDKLNNRSHGRGYVNMPVSGEAELAVTTLNGTMLKGKKIAVEPVMYDPVPHSSWSHSRNM
ncbi:MAG TPA: RNA-binding protein [Flavisolibacter sp.]|nr:RNA-binding protein [Flavisolibacter sp.]